MIGFSRKSSLGKILGDPNARVGSVAASVGVAVTAYERGATIVRAHDVREHVEALRAPPRSLREIECKDWNLFGYHGVAARGSRKGTDF